MKTQQKEININQEQLNSNTLLDSVNDFFSIYTANNLNNYNNHNNFDLSKNHLKNFTIVMFISLFFASFFSNFSNNLIFFLFISYIVAFLSGVSVETAIIDKKNFFNYLKTNYKLYKSVKKLTDNELLILNSFVENFILENEKNFTRDTEIEYYNSADYNYMNDKKNVLLNKLNKINTDIKNKRISIGNHEQSFWIIKKLLDNK